jgi:hypothetical protein
LPIPPSGGLVQAIVEPDISTVKQADVRSPPVTLECNTLQISDEIRATLPNGSWLGFPPHR